MGHNYVTTSKKLSVRAYTLVYAYTHAHVHTRAYARVYARACARVYARACARVYTRVHAHVYTHVHTHVYTHVELGPADGDQLTSGGIVGRCDARCELERAHR